MTFFLISERRPDSSNPMVSRKVLQSAIPGLIEAMRKEFKGRTGIITDWRLTAAMSVHNDALVDYPGRSIRTIVVGDSLYPSRHENGTFRRWPQCTRLEIITPRDEAEETWAHFSRIKTSTLPKKREYKLLVLVTDGVRLITRRLYTLSMDCPRPVIDEPEEVIL